MRNVHPRTEMACTSYITLDDYKQLAYVSVHVLVFCKNTSK